MNYYEFLKDLYPILMELIFTLIIGSVTYIAVPWLKEQRIYSSVRKYVMAAEKLANSGVITKDHKKNYVRKLLVDRGVKITPAVDAMIEAAVEELDLMGQEIVAAFADDEDGDSDEEGDSETGETPDDEGEVF